jgi:hypothetical protein
MHAGLFLGSRYQTWPGSAYLGQVNVGEAVVLRLTWDQPGHPFVARLFKPASGTFVEGQLSYSVSDAIPAVTPYRKLVAALSTPNSVSGQTFAEVDHLAVAAYPPPPSRSHARYCGEQRRGGDSMPESSSHLADFVQHRKRCDWDQASVEWPTPDEKTGENS